MPWPLQTYNVDRQVPDSAGTSTAYLCGVKGNYQTIGLSAAARVSQCSTTSGNEVESVLQRARRAGKRAWLLETPVPAPGHLLPMGQEGS